MSSVNYDEEFFQDGAQYAAGNVRAVLPLVVSELGAMPQTVVDVGCGAGGWVGEFVRAGIDAEGWDGAWAETHLVIDRERFTALDLELALPRDRRFDLAVSIEVAEHLTPARAATFVEDLCALSDAVLFSAAIPRAPGTLHINPQWPSYWIAQFEGLGYGAIDCIRPVLWTADGGWPLSQECFLFVRGCDSRLAMPRDVVHPSSYLSLTDPPGLRDLGREFPRAAKNFAKRRFGAKVWPSASPERE